MSTYAVALINHLDDLGLRLRVVTATTWWSALNAAFPSYFENLKGVLDCDDLGVAQEEAVNQDWEFDVMKVV